MEPENSTHFEEIVQESHFPDLQGMSSKSVQLWYFYSVYIYIFRRCKS